MDTNGDIEMQEQSDKGDANLETVTVQSDIEKEEAVPLLEKFAVVDMREQTKETDENLEEEAAPLLQKFPGKQSYL